MGKIYWLASYPKSGNTWMRTFLSNYLVNAAQPEDINRLKQMPIASNRLWFDDWVGYESSDLSNAEIERLQPQVYRFMTSLTEDILFMKVHDCWRQTDEGKPVFPTDATGGVVYIIRNPLDMAASLSNHNGVDIDRAIDDLADPARGISNSITGLSDQLWQPLGTWSTHAASWLDDSGLPVFPVRYEDMLQNPEEAFGAVLRFCTVPVEEDRLHKAIRFSSFSELQGQEAQKGFRERSNKASQPFFRQGQAGAWRRELNDEQVARIIRAHAPMMRRFGYLDHQNQPL